jgi:hypothetical protein
MNLPKDTVLRAGRNLTCEQALEGTFNQVLHLAEQYGWSRTEGCRGFTRARLRTRGR